MGLTMLNRQNGINFSLHLSEMEKFILGIKIVKIAEYIDFCKYEIGSGSGHGKCFVGLQAVPMSSVRQLTVNARSLRIRWSR